MNDFERAKQYVLDHQKTDITSHGGLGGFGRNAIWFALDIDLAKENASFFSKSVRTQQRDYTI